MLMVTGIGIDMATISRLEKSMARPGFLKKVFGPDELRMFEEKGMRAETVAANFAAKEAFGKALGTGLSGFSWPEVQALRDEDGAPIFRFSGDIAQMMQQKGLTAHLSLTHENDFSTAFVVLEKRG